MGKKMGVKAIVMTNKMIVNGVPNLTKSMKVYLPAPAAMELGTLPIGVNMAKLLPMIIPTMIA